MEVEDKEQYRVKVSNRFAALEDTDTGVDINTVCRKTITDNIKISANDSLAYYELKKYMPWFDEGCSKMIMLKDTSQSALDTGFRQNK
jgi:hypothetical protein